MNDLINEGWMRMRMRMRERLKWDELMEEQEQDEE